MSDTDVTTGAGVGPVEGGGTEDVEQGAPVAKRAGKMKGVGAGKGRTRERAVASKRGRRVRRQLAGRQDRGL